MIFTVVEVVDLTRYYKFLLLEDDEPSIKEQIERAKAIQAIGDDDDDTGADFLPSHFRSSAKGKKKNQENNDGGKKVKIRLCYEDQLCGSDILPLGKVAR